MKAAALVTIPIVTVWQAICNLFVRRELSGKGIEIEYDVQIKEGERELKKLLMILMSVTMLTGCSLYHKGQVAETIARIIGRDMGYRQAQFLNMLETQAANDPLMAANLRDLAGLLSPDAGIFTTGLDQAAQDGFEDGKRLFHER